MSKFVVANTSVFQNWVVGMPLRMQSTLVLGLRGPDMVNMKETKLIIRWLRGLTFKPGNPENVSVFMAPAPGRIVDCGPCSKELEMCAMHFYGHLMHSLEVVGYVHPDSDIRAHAYNLYMDMCNLLHLDVESFRNFYERLKHKDWPGGVQPDTFEEALAMVTAHTAE